MKTTKSSRRFLSVLTNFRLNSEFVFMSSVFRTLNSISYKSYCFLKSISTAIVFVRMSFSKIVKKECCSMLTVD
jgi:NADH:ubiquinone oxidoreductase subunit H